MRSWHRLWVRVRAMFRQMKPQNITALGFLSYIVLGVAALSLPFAHTGDVSLVDNLFTVTSAVSTTGLATVSTGDGYTFFGQLTILLLFQVGALGYMTLSSFVLLARKSKLPPGREKLMAAQFTLPKEFQIAVFLKQVIVFSLVIETLGAAILYVEFRAAGVSDAWWHAVFHSVSAFCTAGFSLNNDSLEAYRGNVAVNVTIAVLCYCGGLGFIVLVDAWRRVTRKGYRMTITSRLILLITAALLIVLTPVFTAIDPHIAYLPPSERWLAAAFQVMTAGTTAGFNTVPISQLGASTLFLITLLMVVGASPSGTGGGVKTTTVTALFAMCVSTLRGQRVPTLWGSEIPTERLHVAVSSMSLYVATLLLGIFCVGLTQGDITLGLFFECASALGTVGLSMGDTGNLTTGSKLVVIGLMFMGRIGPLTAGYAFVARRETLQLAQAQADLA
ncbi:MAG: potassium transporter KtrB [Planctomycetes bacterium]|nr:potassium transporter KtrB [Planctomycetota bacterium]